MDTVKIKGYVARDKDGSIQFHSKLHRGNEFEKFLKENNYEDDLEFQLCDLEMAFNAGKELQWKPSDEQIKTLEYYMHTLTCNEYKEVLFGLMEQLKKLK